MISTGSIFYTMTKLQDAYNNKENREIEKFE